MPEPAAGVVPAAPGGPGQGLGLGLRHRPPLRLRLLMLVAAVLGLHLLLADGFLAQRAGWGAGDRPPPRIDVAFVRELAAAAPPAAPAAPSPAPTPAATPARLPALASRPRPAASAVLPDAAASAAVAGPTPPGQTDDLSTTAAALPVDPTPRQATHPDPAPNAVAASTTPAAASAPPALATTAATTAATAAATAAASATAATTTAANVNWPPSTRLTFNLSGYYRGPVDGSAEVEWLRSGNRYQVRMRTAIGPVLSRLITSDGELTDAGLSPRRFDAEQKVLFRAARRWSLRFGPEQITLDDGRSVPTLPGAQDEASQFVQLTWLFTQRPERLQVGQSVELPLIISRTLDRWVYDVVGEETLQLPFGAVPTVHVKPRRAAKAGDLSAEIWFAPSLQTLPVRILIRQNADSWVDLTLDKPPLQAADPGPALR